MMVSAPLIRIDNQDGVACITLAQPTSRNALSSAMLAALQKAFVEIASSKDVRVVILTTDGPGFCSGHDLKEITAARTHPDGGKAFFAEMLTSCALLMQSIVALPQPVIAAVEGMATAAGCQLVASCDLAIAGASAQFCTPGVNIGLFCSTPMVALSRNLARKHAMEMLLLGDELSAQEAYRFGLVNRVVAVGEAFTVARALAERISSKSTLAVSIGKAAFYAQIDAPLPEAYVAASRAMLANMLAADAAEGIAAFLEKRPANWRNA